MAGSGYGAFLRDSFDSAQICLTLEQVRLKAQDRMKTTAVAVVADGAQVGWALWGTLAYTILRTVPW